MWRYLMRDNVNACYLENEESGCIATATLTEPGGTFPVTRIPISAITIPPRRRPLQDVAQLAESIGDGGLLHPIMVTDDGRLVFGHHRLEACRRLGWTHIPAHVVKAES